MGGGGEVGMGVFKGPLRHQANAPLLGIFIINNLCLAGIH